VKETGERKMWRSEREYHQKFFFFVNSHCKLMEDVGMKQRERERGGGRGGDVTVYSIYSDHVPLKLIQNFSQTCLFFLTPPM